MPRFETISLHQTQTDLKQELRECLSAAQKTLPAKYFYDEAGSRLFEQICELPEYYLTRTENDILSHQSASIIENCPSPLTLVELGSGNATKTSHLITACLQRQKDLVYYPIDVSQSALQAAAGGLLPSHEALRIVGLVGEYESGLAWLNQHPDEPHLVAFLGSTIGNFDEDEIDEFFSTLREHLRPIDRFLLGYDLLKDTSILIPAYNDSQGVTAQFNLNLLARLNREFAADFDLAAFDHTAIFNESRSRIEMHLRSKQAQTVSISGLDLTISLAKDETIHTENSYKHSGEAMVKMLRDHGFQSQEEFTDAKRMFCLTLVR